MILSYAVAVVTFVECQCTGFSGGIVYTIGSGDETG